MRVYALCVCMHCVCVCACMCTCVLCAHAMGFINLLACQALAFLSLKIYHYSPLVIATYKIQNYKTNHCIYIQIDILTV